MFSKILKSIEENDRIVIFGHKYPDGDCYGAAIGLREIIKTAYPDKTVLATGSGLPGFHNIISPIDVVEDNFINKSLAILVDANSLNRAEDARIYNAKCWAKIDHHIDLKDFNEGPEVIVESAVSTCEIVVDFALQNNLKINKIAAKALFLGMLTDSGRFQYYTDFAKAFDTSKMLVELGADPKELYEVLNVVEERNLQFVGHLYSNYKKTKDGVIYVILTQEECKKYGIESVAAANNVRRLANVEGIQIAAFFVEKADGKMVTEYRSSCFNVQKIAAKYGGGGHVHAAGLTLNEFNMENINMILRDLDELIQIGEKE